MKNFCSFCILICMANIFIINAAFAGEKIFGGSIGTGHRPETCSVSDKTACLPDKLNEVLHLYEQRACCPL